MDVTLILQYDIEGVNNPWEPTKESEENVDNEIGITTALEEHSQRREDKREDDLYDV